MHSVRLCSSSCYCCGRRWRRRRKAYRRCTIRPPRSGTISMHWHSSGRWQKPRSVNSTPAGSSRRRRRHKPRSLRRRRSIRSSNKPIRRRRPLPPRNSRKQRCSLRHQHYRCHRRYRPTRRNLRPRLLPRPRHRCHRLPPQPAHRLPAGWLRAIRTGRIHHAPEQAIPGRCMPHSSVCATSRPPLHRSRHRLGLTLRRAATMRRRFAVRTRRLASHRGRMVRGSA